MILINGLHYDGKPPVENVMQSILANMSAGVHYLNTLSLESNLQNNNHVKQAVQYTHSAIKDAERVANMLGTEPYGLAEQDYSHFADAVQKSKLVSEALLKKVGTNGHDPSLSEKDLEVILNGAQTISNIFDSAKVKIAPYRKYNLVATDINTGYSKLEGTYEKLDDALKTSESNNTKFGGSQSEVSDDPLFNHYWEVYDDRGLAVKKNTVPAASTSVQFFSADRIKLN